MVVSKWKEGGKERRKEARKGNTKRKRRREGTTRKEGLIHQSFQDILPKKCRAGNDLL